MPRTSAHPPTPHHPSSDCSSTTPSPTSSSTMAFETMAIHCGQQPDPTTGAIIPPIYLTSTYEQQYPAQHKGFDYTRAGNPSFSALEQQLAALECGKFCTVFSSGLAGITCVIMSQMMRSKKENEDAEVIAFRSCYGGTFRLLNVLQSTGVKTSFVNVHSWEEEVAALLKNDDQVVAVADGNSEQPSPPRLRKNRMFLFETPTNPLLEVIDIAAVVKVCKAHNIVTVVDNTFATPYLQRPLEFGVDVALHSCTKYIGGHSDVVGGCAVTNNVQISEVLRFYSMSMGFNPSPFDCWMLSRSLKTLAVRVQRHSENAMEFSKRLSNHPHVRSVSYPGLPVHPQHEIAKKQTHNGWYGGMVSMDFVLEESETMDLISSMKVFTLAESLGGVESLVEHPASMTHASIPKEERAAAGIHDGLVRFSVGIENVNDLVIDVESAIDRILQKRSSGSKLTSVSPITSTIKLVDQQTTTPQEGLIGGTHLRRGEAPTGLH
eukprot:GHVS01090928.1.p1 GENE.GHVS01090928.1~~GHVS01090928.1.p1  ORF type:complete len:491 (-),score=71.45 GHVS01090928.1:261-1733(-)